MSNLLKPFLLDEDKEFLDKPTEFYDKLLTRVTKRNPKILYLISTPPKEII